MTIIIITPTEMILGSRVRGRAGPGTLFSQLLFCWLEIPESEITIAVPAPLVSAVLWGDVASTDKGVLCGYVESTDTS